MHLALEWGSKFINLEMAWTAEGDTELRLPAGFKSHRMPLHVVELKMKLSDLKMVVPRMVGGSYRSCFFQMRSRA